MISLQKCAYGARALVTTLVKIPTIFFVLCKYVSLECVYIYYTWLASFTASVVFCTYLCIIQAYQKWTTVSYTPSQQQKKNKNKRLWPRDAKRTKASNMPRPARPFFIKKQKKKIRAINILITLRSSKINKSYDISIYQQHVYISHWVARGVCDSYALVLHDISLTMKSTVAMVAAATSIYVWLFCKR
jgi:hypothetical protein